MLGSNIQRVIEGHARLRKQSLEITHLLEVAAGEFQTRGTTLTQKESCAVRPRLAVNILEKNKNDLKWADI